MDEHFTAQTKLMQSLIQHQKTMIPKFLQNCRIYLNNATSLNFLYHFQSQVLMNVTCILAITNSIGTLTINDRSWPVNGFTLIPLGSENGLIVRPEDAVNLTQITAGAMSLEFFGFELPDRGRMW